MRFVNFFVFRFRSDLSRMAHKANTVVTAHQGKDLDNNSTVTELKISRYVVSPAKALIDK